MSFNFLGLGLFSWFMISIVSIFVLVVLIVKGFNKFTKWQEEKLRHLSVTKEEKIKLLTPFVYKERLKWLTKIPPNIAEKINLMFNRSTIIKVNMFLENGDETSYLVNVKNGMFEFKGNPYIINPDYFYYNFHDRFYCLDYHEGFTLPVKRVINLNDLKKGFKDASPEISYIVNPALAKAWLKSDGIAKIMSGSKFTKLLTTIFWLIIIVLILSGITLMVIIFKIGKMPSG